VVVAAASDDDDDDNDDDDVMVLFFFDDTAALSWAMVSQFPAFRLTPSFLYIPTISPCTEVTRHDTYTYIGIPLLISIHISEIFVKFNHFSTFSFPHTLFNFIRYNKSLELHLRKLFRWPCIYCLYLTPDYFLLRCRTAG
jgi:hypothetical protein